MAIIRSNISSIGIQNFKFFPALKNPIQVEGKNVLLFGENGSGKSAIFWAIYTLLEASNKEDESQIKKYFDSSLDAKESLRNINIIPGTPEWKEPFINVSLVDRTEYNVSFNDTSVLNKLEVQQNNYASEFLNYRFLFRIHDFKHSQDIDLFDLFEKDVFPYIKFSPVKYWHKKIDGTIEDKETENSKQIWEFVKIGPQKNIKNKQGWDRYPFKYESQNAEYVKIIESFKKDLNSLLTYITTQGNPILINDLKQPFEFKLSLIEKRKLYLTEQTFLHPEYTIRLDITKYYGKENVVLKPHSFLNEAKLNALALAIHLTILKRRPEEAKLRLAILDDLLISLDMSNRDKITRLIFDKYAWYRDSSVEDTNLQDKNYQTFIFTHDRSYFTWVKHEIENLPVEKKDNWKIIEMYVQDPDPKIENDYEKPIIFDSENELSIAWRHFGNHDYPSAANYLRKYIEKLLEWFPKYCWQDSEKVEKSNSKQDLYNIFEQSISLLDRAQLNSSIYKELKKYTKVLLNPLSHADVGVDRYKEEIIEIFNLVKKTENFQSTITREKLCVAGDEAELAIYNPIDRKVYVGIYLLKENVYRFHIENFEKLTLFKAKIIGCYDLDNTNNQSQIYKVGGSIKDMHENYDEFCNRHNLPKIVNWWKLLFKFDGTQLIP